MPAVLDLYEVYEQNLNFLIGAGASNGFLPTLQLNLKDHNGSRCTFETLAKYLKEANKERLYTLLFMYYYKKCIWTGLPRANPPPFPPDRQQVLNEYETFLKTLIKVLEKQTNSAKKCNIYTTNYDSCLEIAADYLNRDGSINFIVNDGSDGFQFRRFHTKNYSRRIVQKGIFDRYNWYIPQINILHPHGSVYWKKDQDGIQVDYGQTEYEIKFTETETRVIADFGAIVEDSSNDVGYLISQNKGLLSGSIRKDFFWENYSRIPIVNPTKWKFHETVFEEAYYQILRHLSFELERPNSTLITFGFSFSDEHILHLVQRSLSNPSLTVYISCFDANELEAMKEKFKGFNNVKYISEKEEIDFASFNKNIFTLEESGGPE